ncbi:MAG TPA: HAD family phosphatase [Atribacteraceae bacterium]|nr:HAD family phosphatase [Atribacteraceae bacterium]
MKIHLQCLVFDYGGVISKKQDSKRVADMAAIFDLAPDDFTRAYSMFRDHYDAGAIDYREFWRKIADTHRVSLTAEAVEQLRDLDVRSWSVIDPDMVSFLVNLRRSISTMAVISNITPDLLTALRPQAPWFTLFDELVFSCEERIVKPNPQIFLTCLSRLALSACTCLFIDDTPANVEAARMSGMHAFHYQNLESFREELEARYVLN